MTAPINDFFTYMGERDSGISHEEVLEFAERLAREEGERDLQSTVDEVVQRIIDAQRERAASTPDADVTAPAREALQKLRAHVIVPLKQGQSTLRESLNVTKQEMERTQRQKEELNANLHRFQRQLQQTPATTRFQEVVEQIGQKALLAGSK